MDQTISPKTQAMLKRRERLLGPNMATFYDDPVHLVRGEDVWLWDADGKKYLDCYNNVPHVGHGNRRVIDAITHQATQLNTHTRYLHDNILDYVERLTAMMGDGLDTAMMTCTGSEANDIAMRMAEAVTGKRGIIATDFTYHGNTALVSQLSKSNVPGVGGIFADMIRFVPAPDSFRPLGGEAGAAHANAFAAEVGEQIQALEATEHGFGGILIDPFFTNEGFPDLPAGWLKPTVDVVRKAGGIVICDEVQPGFGRIGSHMWGYQFQGIQPDVVTMGKPMANGHPVGAVVARSEVLSKFRHAFRYFNTFGGNPVSCAAAMSVLDEIERLNLVANAKDVGGYAIERMKDLQSQYSYIGDVRGKGLIFGAEFILNAETKEPATEFTKRVVNALRQRGIILSSLGQHKNILKIRPPMVFSRSNVDHLFTELKQVLADTPLML
ncbi:MAG: 4-aminobutyrate aminotransferase-like enzyme [Paracoccaceae bacterium]